MIGGGAGGSEVVAAAVVPNHQLNIAANHPPPACAALEDVAVLDSGQHCVYHPNVAAAYLPGGCAGLISGWRMNGFLSAAAGV